MADAESDGRTVLERLLETAQSSPHIATCLDHLKAIGTEIGLSEC